MAPVWIIFLGVLLRLRPSTATGECGGVSRQKLDFLGTFNGRYSNCKQGAQGQGGHDFLQVKAVPLELPNLSEEPLLYVEQATNGRLDMLLLGSLVEGENGVLILTPHIFTNRTRFRFDEYDINSLSSLTRDDIQTIKGCDAVIQALGNGEYLMNWPDCIDTINGQHPTYSIVQNCDGQHSIVPAGGHIKPVPVPYIQLRYGDRYPVAGAPSDYVSPCKRRRYTLYTD